MSILSTQFLIHRRHLHAVTIPIFPTVYAALAPPALPIAAAKSNFHTSGALLRPGYKPERNPKIGITLEQLRMAARGQGRRLPICHEQQEKVMNALEAAKYENHAIYKYIKEYDMCREDYDLHHKGKDKVLMRELNKYLVRPKRK